MERFFTVLGKLALIVIVLAGLVGIGVYIGKSGLINKGKNLTSQQTTSTQNQQPLNLTPSETPTTTVNPTITTYVKPKKTITAGLPSSSGLSFLRYQLSIPTDWVDKLDTDSSVPMETLTITKDLYQIKIYQAATGGGLCLYPGDPTPEGPSSTYSTFVELKTADGRIFRRSGNGPSAGKMSFTMCQKSSSGDYQLPTPFGHMSLTMPATFDASILQEIDDIISSMKAI